MIEMPAKLNERWGHVWAQARPGYFMDGPWWDYTAQMRCDGLKLYSVEAVGKHTLVTRGQVPVDPRGEWFPGKEALSEAMTRIDKAHPLPVPPPMPGQVWAFPDGEAQVVAIERRLLCGVVGQPENPVVNTYVVWSTPLLRLNPQGHHAQAEWLEKQWPVRSAILVAGPSQYGRDIPWCPPEEK